MDDTITGGDRWNTIHGGGGDDTIVAGRGFDSIEPGGGNDDADAGPGRDTVSYDHFSAPVVVDLRTGQATGAGDEDTLVSITNILGTRRFSDRLIGDEQDNRLHGGRSAFSNRADVLIGGGGDDVLQAGELRSNTRSLSNDDRLFGGAGNDQLKGRCGSDLLVGGPGRDSLKAEGGDDRIRARDGTRDTVRGGPHFDSASVDSQLDDVSGIELFFGQIST